MLDYTEFKKVVRKNALAKAQRICKKYGITYGDYVAWTVTD